MYYILDIEHKTLTLWQKHQLTLM